MRKEINAVNPGNSGTKAAFWYDLGDIEPGEMVEVWLRLCQRAPDRRTFGLAFDAVLASRQREADEFYASVIHLNLSEEDRHVARRAYAGPLWGKQAYRYNVEEWIEGDPTESSAPDSRRGKSARNAHWGQLALADVISMSDEWEYPWFAACDLAFHAIPLAHADPDFAKEQLVLMCREWSMHPNGQLPAYEWEFGDVNPPVHAWAAWRVYRIDGYRDRDFLIRVFTKLVPDFSRWINLKDADGSNIFEGGLLGMDAIGCSTVPETATGYRLEQSDATSWMAFYCQQMFKIALVLSRHDQAWDEMATKFLEDFLSIAKAMITFGSHDMSLWHEDDGFFTTCWSTRPEESWFQGWPAPEVRQAGTGDLVRRLRDRRLDTSAPQRIPNPPGGVRLVRQHPVRRGPGVPPQLLMIEMSAITGVKATESCRCPAVVTRAIGRHRESATRWIFVVTPPRLRPKPSRSGTAAASRRNPCHSMDPPVLLTGVTATSNTGCKPVMT